MDDLWHRLFPAEQARIIRLLVRRVTLTEAVRVVDLVKIAARPWGEQVAAVFGS